MLELQSVTRHCTVCITKINTPQKKVHAGFLKKHNYNIVNNSIILINIGILVFFVSYQFDQTSVDLSYVWGVLGRGHI